MKHWGLSNTVIHLVIRTMRYNEITMGNTWGIIQSGKRDNKRQLIHRGRLDYGKHRGIEKVKLKQLVKMTE